MSGLGVFYCLFFSDKANTPRHAGEVFFRDANVYCKNNEIASYYFCVFLASWAPFDFYFLAIQWLATGEQSLSRYYNTSLALMR